ncbi:MAG TPA: FkbM family methyltransferase [Solirubrobacteraceae bacterium]|nr:FkbM family methyltransferase [Solirubrobacteraceae bacterium]
MPANSQLRRAAKRSLAPVLGERVYRLVQAASMARDIRSGALTEPELDVALRAVAPGEAAIDVGANYGMYAYPLSRAVGRSGSVHAFEPIPFTVTTLRTVLRLLRVHNVVIHDQACGEQAGRTSFAVPVQRSGAISAGQAHAATRNDDRAGHDRHVRWDEHRELTCDVVTLDSALANERREIALIKADVEGMELSALRGAVGILECWHPTVICEINPWFLEGFGIELGELIGFFADRGYQLHRYRDDRPRLVPVADLTGVDEDNYVFVHPARRPRLGELLGS